MTLSTSKFGLLLCEGKEDVTVFNKIAEHASLGGIDIRDFGGKDRFGAYLKMLSNSPEYVRGRISRILLTRDADEEPSAAIESLSTAVEQHLGSNPRSADKWLRLSSGTEIAIWVAPGGNRPGMIESLCLDAAKNATPDTFDCLETYTDCLQQKHGIELHEKERFAIWTLAAQGQALGRKSLPFSDALQRMEFDWGHETFNEIRRLIAECSATKPTA